MTKISDNSDYGVKTCDNCGSYPVSANAKCLHCGHNHDYGQQLLHEWREIQKTKRMATEVMDAVSAYPAEFTAQWYRLRQIKTLNTEQMESMLAFLSGYDPVAWDLAYSRAPGATPITLDENDPDYPNEDYLWVVR